MSIDDATAFQNLAFETKYLINSISYRPLNSKLRVVRSFRGYDWANFARATPLVWPRRVSNLVSGKASPPASCPNQDRWTMQCQTLPLTE